MHFKVESAKVCVVTSVKNRKICVLGGGSFGTVIANMLAENNHDVCLWLRNADRAAKMHIQHENLDHLPNYRLDERLHVSTDMAHALNNATVVFVSVPSKAFRDVLRQAQPFLHADAILVSTAKGIEPDGFWLMSDVLRQELPTHRIAVISGPNLAAEIAQRQLTGTVVASSDAAVCTLVQSLLRSSYFRVYSNSDVYGVELGGVLKNIYAIACGMAAALGVGQNTISLLITRSLAEMGRFAAKLGADPLTFIGLAGVGDLIATCSSPLSRNYRIGFALGQGHTLEQAVIEVGQVAEGINTVHLVAMKAEELGVYMPLANALNDIVFKGFDAAKVAVRLMSGDSNIDVEYRANLTK